jgi:hypothetical protein
VQQRPTASRGVCESGPQSGSLPGSPQCCPQLGLPSHAARFVRPTAFASKIRARNLDALAFLSNTNTGEHGCPGAADARSILDCEVVTLLPDVAPNCMVVSRLYISPHDNGLPYNYVPAAVECR